jgi:outer membrane scaffolding protein for murein synthesis (MipA/OmpV family)
MTWLSRDRILCVAFGLWAVGPVRADQPLWEAGVGAAGLRLPHYRGSDQSNQWLLPLPFLIYRGDVFRADRDGARALLFESQRIDLDLSFAASAPSNSDDNLARQGMPDLAPTVEIGPKLNLNLWRDARSKLDLRLPLRAVITLQSRPRAIGWSFEPVLNLDHKVLGFDLGLQAGPLWGSRKLHGYFYDVAPVDASSARPAYQAKGGWAGWQATAALSRRFGPAWAGLYVRSDSLRGATFEDSPLVRSRHALAYGVAMSWVLASSQARVPDRD